jgi:serine/threonine-protein kinase
VLISAVAVVGSLVVGYAVAALWLFPRAASADDASVVRVPDVVGLSEAEARAAAVDIGLDLKVAGGMNHREVPEGSVLSQRPLPGQYARAGAPIEAMLSRGPEVHTLPDVAGLSERQAGIVLERLGFEVEVETREDPIPAGRAIETRPSAGTELPVPGRLVLVVSEGAPIVVVPDMRGLHIDDAVRILADAGLELGSLSFDPLAVEAPGRIVGQYPPEGYSLRAGDGVELRVAGDRDDLGADREEPGGRRGNSSNEEPGLL